MHQVVALLFSSSILSDFLGCPVDLRSGCGISCVGECGGSEQWQSFLEAVFASRLRRDRILLPVRVPSWVSAVVCYCICLGSMGMRGVV